MAGLASEVIKEYLVSLGFKVDEKSASDVNMYFGKKFGMHCSTAKISIECCGRYVEFFTPA